MAHVFTMHNTNSIHGVCNRMPINFAYIFLETKLFELHARVTPFGVTQFWQTIDCINFKTKLFDVAKPR